ncbi:MAG: hypothetical protein M1836_005918 [Candelina mexicana]|nr:MAG: hypothetical protein M1836_005918 [Candelina mexicana]
MASGITYAHHHSSASASSDSELSDPLDLRDEEGWEDAEPEEDNERIVCLFSDEIFPDVPSMIRHCKDNFDFDFKKVQKELALDFYGAVKLINYIRSEVRAGNSIPTVLSKQSFEDEKYLHPALEDDALLFNLDEILGRNAGDEPEDDGQSRKFRTGSANADTLTGVNELKEELQRLQTQFSDYRQAVKKTLDESLDAKDASLAEQSSSTAPSRNGQHKNVKDEKKEDDSHYFVSYSYNGEAPVITLGCVTIRQLIGAGLDIHETMLKDTVRTDAYRDFIYDNKNVFKSKVVLDVGCGTGILSMFCAKAGARKVIAVDNSDIIDKARENVFENGLGETITCLRGKIEDVALPVQQVDIIVSEWMGYCLLYEAMLDSVLWARDHYLAPNGLMVPSHINLHLAPLTDSDYITDHISFWNSVYGFKMSSMLANIYDDVLIRHLTPNLLASAPTAFNQLPLHSVTTDDLTFAKRFSVELNQDIESLDGWVIWFDTFFLSSREDSVPVGARAEEWVKQGHKGVAFTTGPGGPETHWRQGVLLVDHGKKRPEPLSKGQVIDGEVGYKKHEDNARELDIEISWNVQGAESGKQRWFMR